MARPPIRTGKPAAKGPKKTGSAQDAKSKSSQSGAIAKPAIASRGAAAKPVPLGQVSKGELRAQIEKLELANAKLRARNREAGREAKLSANRIGELEKQVAQLEKKLKPKAAPIASPDKGTKTRRLAKAVPAVPEVGAPSDAGNAENQSLDRDVTPAGEAEPDR